MSASSTNPPPTAPAWRSPAAWVWMLGFSAAGVALDLATKRLAFGRVASVPVVIRREDVLRVAPPEIGRLIPRHEPIHVVPHVLDLQLVLNPGAVFGIGPGRRWVFVVFTLLAIAFALWVFARWTTAANRWSHAALGLVLAGGIGNLYDRIVHGCVRDFLHPLPGVRLPFGLRWPSGSAELWPWVSNVADALLLIGIAVLVVNLWRPVSRSSSVTAAQT